MAGFTRLEIIAQEYKLSPLGSEIVVQFYCEPFAASFQVHKTLLGYVDKSAPPGNPNGEKVWTRHKPTTHGHFKEFYCTEAEIMPLDQSAHSCTESLWNGMDDNGAADTYALGRIITCDDLRKLMQKERIPEGDASWTFAQPADPKKPESKPVVQWGALERPGKDVLALDNTLIAHGCGAVITATFRPLITQRPSGNTGEQAYWDWEWTRMEGWNNPPDSFDFVDPQLQPVTKVVSTGTSLKYILPGMTIFPKVGSEGFITQSMQTLTIRRLMVPFVPVNTITRLKGKVNRNEFRINEYVFAPQTLRFDDCIAEKRVVSSDDGKTLSYWYDLTYVFSWNTIYDEYEAVTFKEDFSGLSQATFKVGYVGWNRIFGKPTDSLLGTSLMFDWFNWKQIFLGVFGAPVTEFPTAYYLVGTKALVLGPYRPLYLWDSNARQLGNNGAFWTLFPEYKSGTPNGFADLFNFSGTDTAQDLEKIIPGPLGDFNINQFQ